MKNLLVCLLLGFTIYYQAGYYAADIGAPATPHITSVTVAQILVTNHWVYVTSCINCNVATEWDTAFPREKVIKIARNIRIRKAK